jgi:hypothetical protein
VLFGPRPFNTSAVNDRSDPYWHVTSSRNRQSILEHGLDWRRMAFAPGIAGSPVPEQEGCFLSAMEFDVEFFVRMNNTGGPVDVWEVSGVDPDALRQSPEGFWYLPGAIAPRQLRLIRRDVPPAADPFG